MNGVDALRELRKEKALRQVPVIAVSASAMKGDHENFMGIGFDGYISKPIDHHLFEEKIKEFLC
jgi:CheY-like chemotaxis protein